MVRKIAARVFDNNYSKAWDKIYAEMLYKYNIGVTQRKNQSKLSKPTIFDVLDEEETKSLVKSCLSLCEMYRVDINDLMMEK
jgi:fructosamine-3-kinase